MSNLLNKVKIGNVLISLFFLFCTYSIKSQNSSQTENTSKNEQAPINDQNSKSSNDASNTKNNIEITKANSDPTPLFNTENLTASFDKKSQKSISANEISGALNYLFNITIPPGRNNFQPDIKLKYSNQDGSSTPNIIGYGWNIEIPTISRINKSGTNKLYSSDYFYSSMSGELIKVAGNSNVYAPKVENGDFLTYTLSSGSWIVKDKKGTIFKFGSLAQSRQDNPNKNTEVYKWSLDEIRNTDNNYIKFEYFKNDGQIYPDKITYTGNGSIDGIFKIEFLRESRNDILKSYATAFLVTTNYRISEIKISINNTWVRKYQLSYSVGDNGYRSLLSSIIESGQDENSNVISLPPTSFNYYESQAGWTLNTSNWTSPTLFANGFQSMLDINGDALPDIIESYKPSMTTPNVFKTYINKNNGTWGINSGLQPPIIFRDREVRGGSYENSWDQGVRIGDVNGDLLPDIIKAEDNEHGKGGFDAYINTNGDTWTQSNNWHPTITFNGDDNIDSWGSHLLDLNADGLPDVIRKKQTPFFGSQINQGSIFGQESHSELNLPLEDLTGPKTRLIDLNGDNLPDVINMVWNQSKVDYDQLTYLNAGNGNWILDNSGNWDLPVEIVHSDNTTDSGARFFDVNADGLPDLVPDFTLMESGRDTYLNTGSGWTCAVEWNVPEDVQINFDSQPISIIDLNSDGTLDFFITQNSNPAITKAFINNTSTPTDALKKVILPEGGYIDFVYKNSPLYKDASNNQLNTHLPLTLMTVHQITTNDLNGVSSTDTYSYEGGEYFFSTWDNRKPSGFSKITKKDNLGIQSISYYHQGNTTNSSKGEFADHYSKIGKVYRTELLDSIGNIFHVTINKWDKYNLGSDRDYVKLDRTTILTYDGDSDHKDLSTTFTYDSVNGNLIKQVNWGEVSGQNDGSFSDLGNDKYTTDITYAINQANYILGLPKQVIITNQAGLKVRENKFYYDNLTFGNVNKGNLTTEEKWKSASEYISLKKTYDGIFGLVTIEKDGKDNATIYTFDSYYLYPSSIKNPLLDSINYSYDYSLGKPKKVTDQNNFIYETVYDALDRIKEERIPNYLAPYSPIVKTSYAYTNTPGAISILKSDYLDSTNSINTFQYFDGLNRLIQERIEAEDSNKYSARDIIYNPVGLVYKESLPYFSTGSVKTSPTTATNLYNVFTYDADKRLKNITNSIGTTITTYDDWKTSVIDPNGKVKNSYKDAFNNIIQVDEINNGASYITKYEWNGNNKLTKVTDALGNIRIFTYDGLGRRLTAEDLHVVGDQTFGTWSYTYDNADNIINIVDPKNQSTNFTYNALNQVLSEDFTGGTGTEISYTYSGCLNGIDLLCNVVTNNGINTSYSYNSNHLIANELKTINGINYSTLFNYDRQYNNTEIINPDTSAVRYTYNSAGLPEKIELKEGGSNYSALVNNFDYGPHRKIIKQQNNNKTETITSYDPNKMYRLSRILTNSYKNVNYKSEDTSINLINKDQATIKPRNIESAKLSAISSVKTFQSSASGDGEVLATNTNWNTVREATTGTANSSATIGYASTQWWSWTSPKEINRMTLPFNTSDLPDDASIISANLKVYVLQVYNNENDGNDFIRVVQNTTESPTALVAEDYDQIGELNNPIAGSSDIDLGTIAINEYLSFSLNTTGQSWINKTGWSKLGLREGHDAMNDPLTAPGGSAIKIYTSNYNVNYAPYLEVTYIIPNQVPSSPSSLKTEEEVNPLEVFDSTPEFTAIYNDPNTIDTAVSYRIQVSTTANFSNPIWDSGKKSLNSIIGQGNECNPITYAGSTLPLDGSKYYWRIKFWDDDDAEGSWSLDTASFTMYNSAIDVLQDLNFTYDANGNITKIVDASETNTLKTVNYTYDDLNRLINASATNVAPGQSTYSHSFTYNAIGNIISSPLGSYAYSGSGYSNPHAVTSIGNINYNYDQNGNQISTGLLSRTFDYKNRLIKHDVLSTPSSISFYPQAGDGNVYNNSSTSWATTHDASVGSFANYTGNTLNVGSGKSSNSKFQIDRAFLPFNTASLPDNAIISSGKVKTYVSAKLNNDNDGDDWITITQSTQGNPVNLVTSDYNKAGSVSNPVEGINVSERKDLTNISLNNYLEFNLNSTGIGFISKTSSTKLALREGHDAKNTSYVGTAKTYNTLTLRSSEYSGTNYDPILEVTYSTPLTESYSYDHAGNRVLKTSPSQTTTIPSKYYSKEGNTDVKYIYLPYFAGGEEMLIATVRGKGVNANSFWMHTDHLGSSEKTSDKLGTLVETSDYYPYGQPRVSQTTINDRKGYIGKDYDSGIELSFLEARYYNGKEGKFISQDPVFMALGDKSQIEIKAKMRLENILEEPQSLNSYSYVKNNPIKHIDPNGMWWTEWAFGSQSTSNFILEVGQATQYLADHSQTWNLAINNPIKAGLAVGVVSAATISPATASIASIVSIKTGVGLAYIGKVALGSALYGYVATNTFKSLPNMVQSYSQFDINEIETWKAPVINTSLMYVPGALGETVEAIYNISDSIISVGNKITEKIGSGSSNIKK